MKIILHKNFDKQYKKLNRKEKNKIKEKLILFQNNPFDIKLNNHPLKGKLTDYRSINIKGDLRAIYKQISEKECIFVTIGNHNNLYN